MCPDACVLITGAREEQSNFSLIVTIQLREKPRLKKVKSACSGNCCEEAGIGTQPDTRADSQPLP